MFIKKIFLNVILAFSLLSVSASASYLFDNLAITKRKDRGANEARRNYIPKTKGNETISSLEYKPKGLSDYEKKFKIAENYVVKAYPKEFKISKVLYKNKDGTWLKRPISLKDDKKKIIIHHTAASYSGLNTLDDEIKEIIRIYKYHTYTKDWGDIGYNFLIGPNGTIFEGRAGGSQAIGAHATWNNSDSIGISLMGNFEIEKPTKDQLHSLKKLITALGQQYTINPKEDVTYHTFDTKSKAPHIHNIKMESIIGHRDVGNTSCPGKHLYELLPGIKWETSKQLGYLTFTTKKSPPKIETKKSKETISPKK